MCVYACARVWGCVPICARARVSVLARYEAVRGAALAHRVQLEVACTVATAGLGRGCGKGHQH